MLDGITFPLKVQVYNLGVLWDSSPSVSAELLAMARNAFSLLKLKASSAHSLRCVI